MSDPHDAAAEIVAARDRLVEFMRRLTRDQWLETPLGDADPRSVVVITDHVAHSYGYLGRWVEELVAGERVEISPAIVDDLNAGHASGAGGLTRDTVREHLMHGGDTIAAQIARLRPDHLEIDGGRVGRLAEIAARHADDHRAELEKALGVSSERAANEQQTEHEAETAAADVAGHRAPETSEAHEADRDSHAGGNGTDAAGGTGAEDAPAPQPPPPPADEDQSEPTP